LGPLATDRGRPPLADGRLVCRQVVVDYSERSRALFTQLKAEGCTGSLRRRDVVFAANTAWLFLLQQLLAAALCDSLMDT
jgi:hypothetical protein